MRKGYFPHFFNKAIHSDYIGPMPAKKHYGYDQMSIKDRAVFLVWYEENKDTVFDMRKVISV